MNTETISAKTESPENSASPSSGKNTKVFRVTGMDCGDEIAAIKRALDVPGILKVDANLMASTVSVAFESELRTDDIRKLIEATGVKVANKDVGHDEGISKGRIALVVASGAFVATGMVLEAWGASKGFAIAANALAVTSGGTLVFPKAWRALLRRQLDMNVLMAVATGGAFAIGEYSEAATVVFLFSLSELLEAFSVARARKAVREVLDLTPDQAWRIRSDGGAELTDLSAIQVGELVRVKSGDRVPLDGTVKRGASSVNQAPLTGESVPVEKREGDPVFAGTVNENGILDILVTAGFENSKVSQIIKTIEEAQQSKAPSERFVDKFAKIYTPAVFIGAIFSLLVPPLLFNAEWSVWIYRSLVLLVVACPCALVLATPVSIVSGLTAMARRGVLVKGGAFLEALGRLNAIALDKTGTITEGRPKLLKVLPQGKTSEEELLSLACAIESLSSHPLAQAVVEYGQQKGISAKEAHEFQTVPGRGATALVDGHRYFLGNHRYAHELGVCSPEVEAQLQRLEADALSVIVIGHSPHGDCPGAVLGILGLGDSVRANAANAIQAIHRAGVKKVVMLSGDNQKTASAIASKVGIDQAVGDLLPDDKVVELNKLLINHKYVGMIGDGINDAPALALASVGIAMGAAGTDTAIETADVALMKDDLSQVAVAVEQGRRAVGVIKFNVGFALVVKAVFLVLAFTGYTNLWLAVLADTGASLLVIANALRLLRVS